MCHLTKYLWQFPLNFYFQNIDLQMILPLGLSVLHFNKFILFNIFDWSAVYFDQPLSAVHSKRMSKSAFLLFHSFFYFLGALKTCLTQFSRVLDKHSCVDQHLRKKLKYVAFCLIIHHFLHQNLAKIEKSRVGWVFEVCSTQTQFKIYNTKVFSSDFATTWL